MLVLTNESVVKALAIGEKLLDVIQQILAEDINPETGEGMPSEDESLEVVRFQCQKFIRLVQVMKQCPEAILPPPPIHISNISTGMAIKAMIGNENMNLDEWLGANIPRVASGSSEEEISSLGSSILSTSTPSPKHAAFSTPVRPSQQQPGSRPTSIAWRPGVNGNDVNVTVKPQQGPSAAPLANIPIPSREEISDELIKVVKTLQEAYIVLQQRLNCKLASKRNLFANALSFGDDDLSAVITGNVDEDDLKEWITKGTKLSALPYEHEFIPFLMDAFVEYFGHRYYVEDQQEIPAVHESQRMETAHAEKIICMKEIFLSLPPVATPLSNETPVPPNANAAALPLRRPTLASENSGNLRPLPYLPSGSTSTLSSPRPMAAAIGPVNGGAGAPPTPVPQSALTTAQSVPPHLLITGSSDKTIRIFDLNIHQGQGKDPSIGLLIGHSGAIRCITSMYRPLTNSTWIISGSDDSTVKIWDLARKKVKATLRDHKGSVTCCATWSNRFLITGSRDGSIKFWDLDDTPVTAPIAATTSPANGSSTTRPAPLSNTSSRNSGFGGDRLITESTGSGKSTTSSFNGSVNGSVASNTMGRPGDRTSRNFGGSVAGSTISAVTTQTSTNTAMMSATYNQVVYTIENAHKSGVTGMLVLTEEKRLLTIGRDKKIKLWDLSSSSLSPTAVLGERESIGKDTGKDKGKNDNEIKSDKIKKVRVKCLVEVSSAHDQVISCLSMTPVLSATSTSSTITRHLVTGSHDGTLKLWQITTNIDKDKEKEYEKEKERIDKLLREKEKIEKERIEKEKLIKKENKNKKEKGKGDKEKDNKSITDNTPVITIPTLEEIHRITLMKVFGDQEIKTSLPFVDRFRTHEGLSKKEKRKYIGVEILPPSNPYREFPVILSLNKANAGIMKVWDMSGNFLDLLLPSVLRTVSCCDSDDYEDGLSSGGGLHPDADDDDDDDFDDEEDFLDGEDEEDAEDSGLFPGVSGMKGKGGNISGKLGMGDNLLISSISCLRVSEKYPNQVYTGNTDKALAILSIGDAVRSKATYGLK